MPLITAAIGAAGKIGGSLLQKKKPANTFADGNASNDPNAGLVNLASGGGGGNALLQNLSAIGGGSDMMNRLKMMSFGGV